MPADSIVKTLYVIKHVGLGFLSASIDTPPDSFLLQAAEEGLCNCIVPTVSPATHAGHQLVVFAPAVEII
ncbi:MAG: hypothetical protein ACI802_003620, partial [Candidatus Paceibacteria bacterium]